ncbi:hypothetical protein, partial [Ilumatobacter nonamiensis]|uniref:hypothetical protein n=1 Tax=Ilumatobacter nonamiensis TaxID=467093 RepID=UPI00058F2B33
MTAGYEPHRVAALGDRTTAALDSLAGIGSTDPAADEAMAAVRRIRHALEDRILPAVRAIESTDPLARPARRANHSPGGLGTWLANLIAVRYRAMTDEELLAEFVRLEFDAPYDDEFQPDMGDPFWVRFEALAHELAMRAADDAGFVDELVVASSRSFLVPMAVGFATFDPRLVARMLEEATRSPSAMVDLRSNYQARGAEVMLTFLTQHPDHALRVLDESMLKELIEWPTLDGAVVGRFLSSAMQLPFRDRTRLPEAHGVLRDLVALSNRRLHDTGFPPHLSPEIARIVVQYVPFFTTSLGGYADVHLKDFDFHDVGMELGTYPEVLDLFGALMRDPTSLDILLASIPGLAVIGAGDNGPLGIGPSDVADYVDTLGKAARNEQIEEQIRADRHRRDALLAADIAFDALRVASSVMGPIAIGG